jgi:hypothetical protein
LTVDTEKEEVMSGSKVFVKKPLRRYERAFDEKPADPEVEMTEEAETPVNPDITSPAGLKGPVMNSKKQPLRYKVKREPVKGSEEKKDNNSKQQAG